MPYVTATYCDGQGCKKKLADLNGQLEEGRKIVIACEGPFPPSVFFNYCPDCEIPPIAEIARSHPELLILKIKVRVNKEWILRWSGRVIYSQKTRGFSDDLDKVIPERSVGHGGLVN